MAMIYVKSKPDRKLFYEGKIVPQDQFIPVRDDPFIRRLIHHWEDLEVEGGVEALKPSTAPSRRMKPVEKGPTAPVPGGGRKTLQPTGEQGPGTGAPRPRE
jgi:hypothetical protein